MNIIFFPIIMNTFIPNQFKSLNLIIFLNNIIDYNSDCNIIKKDLEQHVF